MRSATAAVALAFVTAVSPARAQSTTSNELWSRLELTWDVAKRYRVYALAELRRHDDFGDSQAGYGIHFDYTGLTHGYVRVGYRYLYALNEPEHPENRGLVEASLHGVGATRFVNRVRFELRDMSSGLSYRLRERVRVEHHARVGRVPVLPYAMAEVFYDSRVGGFDRVRSDVGSEVFFTPNVGVDVSYVWQLDWRGERVYVNAFYTKLMLTF